MWTSVIEVFSRRPYRYMDQYQRGFQIWQCPAQLLQFSPISLVWKLLVPISSFRCFHVQVHSAILDRVLNAHGHLELAESIGSGELAAPIPESIGMEGQEVFVKITLTKTKACYVGRKSVNIFR